MPVSSVRSMSVTSALSTARGPVARVGARPGATTSGETAALMRRTASANFRSWITTCRGGRVIQRSEHSLCKLVKGNTVVK